MTKDAETTKDTPGYLLHPRYAENGSTRTWGALAIGVASPIVAFFAIIVGASQNVTWLLIPGFACLIIMFTSIGVRAYWAVGIRIDEVGIRIGGCKRTSRWWWHAWEHVRFVKGPTTTRPSTYTLFVPWDGVKSVRVVAEREELHQLINKAPKRVLGFGNNWRYFWQVGVMVPFYTLVWHRQAVRGFLVFDIDVNQAHVPEFRRPSRHFAMPPASTWMCPTRKPKKLQKIVDELQPLLNR